MPNALEAMSKEIQALELNNT
jgi:hypothetical protein